MVLRLVDVADDVVVDDGVLSGAEVPRLLLRVVRAAFEAFELVVEVEDVVGLFVTEGFVLVLSQDIGHVLFLNLADLLLARRVRERLRDWVVLHFLGFHVGVRYLAVRLRNVLLGCLGGLVVFDIFGPRVVAISEAHSPVGFVESVTHLVFLF